MLHRLFRVSDALDDGGAADGVATNPAPSSASCAAEAAMIDRALLRRRDLQPSKGAPNQLQGIASQFARHDQAEQE